MVRRFRKQAQKVQFLTVRKLLVKKLMNTANLNGEVLGLRPSLQETLSAFTLKSSYVEIFNALTFESLDEIPFCYHTKMKPL